MSRTAQREDIYNSRVVMRFVSRFGTKKMLDMIYLLTYADMSGVGGNVYNNYSSELIKILYFESLEALKNEYLLDETARRLKVIDKLKRSHSFQELPKKFAKKGFIY